MTIKRTFWLVAMTLLSLTAHAQHFDWVKSYSGQEPTGKFWNYIVSSVTDSHGNLYVAGQFANGATIDGQDLLPFSPHGGQTENPNSCIMKISPQGNILWTKILHANYGQPTRIYDLQLVGDTALFANVSIPIPKEDNEYLYFYDTLITKDNLDYLLYMDSISYTGITTAISSFDLDGNLNENYLLHTAYKDSKGKLITLDRQTNNDFDSVYILNNQFKPGTFCVDNQGNIYFGHLSTDLLWLFCDTCASQSQSYNLSNGLISEIVIMVNGHQSFANVLSERSSNSNYRIMKFAPHFSDLLACRYVFSYNTESWSYAYNTKLLAESNENHVYLLCNLQQPSATMNASLQGDTSKSVVFTNMTQGIVIEYNNSLFPLDVIQITPEQNISQIISANLAFNNLISSKDSNVLFIIGGFAENSSSFTPTYKNQTIDLGNASVNAFALRIERGNNTLEYFNHIRSNQGTSFMTTQAPVGAVESNGRIFAQAVYKGNIQWSDSNISIANNKFGTGVFVWDYSLRELEFIDLNIESSSRPLASSLSIHDSNLYIMVASKEGFTLSNTTLPLVGNSVAVIARYVDTSFMTPYVPTTDPIDTGEVRITLVEDGTALVAYPNPFRQSVRIKVQGGQLKELGGTVTAILTDLTGRREQVRLTPDAPGQYTLDLTSRPQATYLLTLTTADGRQHTVRLLKQSDIFGN